jgi:hypothetical protein
LAAVIFIEMAASIPRLRALLGAPLRRKETSDLTAAAVEIFLHGCGSKWGRTEQGDEPLRGHATNAPHRFSGSS